MSSPSRPDKDPSSKGTTVALLESLSLTRSGRSYSMVAATGTQGPGEPILRFIRDPLLSVPARDDTVPSLVLVAPAGTLASSLQTHVCPTRLSTILRIRSVLTELHQTDLKVLSPTSLQLLLSLMSKGTQTTMCLQLLLQLLRFSYSRSCPTSARTKLQLSCLCRFQTSHLPRMGVSE